MYQDRENWRRKQSKHRNFMWSKKTYEVVIDSRYYPFFSHRIHSDFLVIYYFNSPHLYIFNSFVAMAQCIRMKLRPKAVSRITQNDANNAPFVCVYAGKKSPFFHMVTSCAPENYVFNALLYIFFWCHTIKIGSLVANASCRSLYLMVFFFKLPLLLC